MQQSVNLEKIRSIGPLVQLLRRFKLCGYLLVSFFFFALNYTEKKAFLFYLRLIH